MNVRKLQAADVFADPTFPFNCEIFQATGGVYPAHTHEFTELEIVFQGSAIETIDGRDYVLGKGSVLAMTGAVTHTTRQTADALMFILQMDAEKLQLFSYDLTALPGYHALFVLEPRLRAQQSHAGYLKLGPHDLAQVEGLALRLRDAWRDKHPGHRYLIRALLMELIGYLCQVYAATDHAGAGDML
ncbi:MAG: AraC family ligand binding domain-containing protein, partial [bacterium]|nr:AraC family ligand binding domain-containing protein [bacterium]